MAETGRIVLKDMHLSGRKKTANGVLLVLPVSHTHYVVPPIGLGYIASSLRREGFNNIRILDCVKEKMSFDNFFSYFSENKPEIAGFQVFSYDFNSVKRSIGLIKKISPKTKIVIGGPHVSATKGDSLYDLEGADFGFVGEAEIGFPMLLKRLLRKDSISYEDIPGLVWRENKRVLKNPRTYIDDLDSLGYPAWDLINPLLYPDSPQGGFYKNFPIAPISTTRGCPYQCTFCGSGVNMGHKLRFRNIERVLDEMEMLYGDFKVREFHIIDDMFNFNKQRVIDFCQGIKRRNLKISYTFPNGLRLNNLDSNILKNMKDTGAYAFTVGIESGSQNILNAMKKDLTIELIEEKVNLIRKSGLEPSGFFLIGYPGETIEDIKLTIKFAKRLKIKRAHFSNFLPLPGTTITEKLIESGEISHTDWSKLFYSKVAYSPKGISKNKLKQLQRRAFLEFHLRPLILFKMLTEIKSFNHLKIILKRAVDYLFSR
ncbi:MAG: radical SAM protein [Candidatus Omnitrophota bacterium]